MTDLHVRVREHLLSLGIAHTVWVHADLPQPIRSPADVAAALHRPLTEITKTVFCRSKSGAYVAVVAPIDHRIDLAAVSHLLDCGRLSMATQQQLSAVTGYPRNGVSPLGLRPEVFVTIASSVLDRTTVLAGGGAEGVEVEIAPEDLLRATGATIY